MKVLAIVQAWDREHPIRGFIVRWMEKLAEHVEKLVVLTLEQRHPSTHSNIEIHSLGKEHTAGGGKRLRYLVRWHCSIRRILRDDPPQIVFTHMSPVFSVLVAPYAKAKGIPVLTWYAHPRLTWMLRMAHRLSNHMVASVPTAYPHRRDKLVAVGQGIDTELFSPNGEVPPEDRPIILCVGRLSPVKDHRTLLKAASLLRQRLGKVFRVVIVGGAASRRDDSYVQLLHKQVEELGLQEIVYFEPPTSVVNLPSWYRRCAVHVNLTPTGFGDKVAWEAMACGKPCLVANEGFRETLGKHAGHLMFHYGDAEDLARALEWVFSLSGTERQRMGVYLREQVVRMHGLDRLAAVLVELFARCIEKKSSRGSLGTGKETARSV